MHKTLKTQIIKFIVTWKSDVADLPESGAIEEHAEPVPLRNPPNGAPEKTNNSGAIEEPGDSGDTNHLTNLT